MKRTTTTTALLVGIIAPMAAGAAGINYNYADLRYVDADDAGLDGVAGEVSGLVADQLFVRGGVSLLSDDGFDADTVSGELGYRHPLSGDVELQASAGLVHGEIDTPFGSEDDTGFLLTGGARAMLTPDIELETTLLYQDLFDDSDLDARIGGLFHLNPRWALGASYQVDAELLALGGRFNFGHLR
ncbi:outer membrane beta-barrel protein [Algiphilus sp.]|uniref:outer membrane beta-barrel protein n=1 Tax=Algiphilus sp. TaxID=1872431 RepID=UPI0025BA08F2|nr:outer membrane beta-barrel protein [Algiphilus sp.]MCK5770361.1 outer membrane beta-barrel protein [Algiphilus sp.]